MKISNVLHELFAKGNLKMGKKIRITICEIAVPPPICNEYKFNDNCGPAHRLCVCVWGGEGVGGCVILPIAFPLLKLTFLFADSQR
jgi:hypothetical protein